MGFFSRFFSIREQDSSSPETTWAVEDNGSELVLDDEYASMLMTEIEIDAAIVSHEGWRLQLQDMVHGRSSEVMRPAHLPGRPLRPGPVAQRFWPGTAGAFPGVWHAGGAPSLFSPAGCRRHHLLSGGRPGPGPSAAQRPLPPCLQPGAVAAQRTQAGDGAISLVVRCHGPLNGGVGVAAGDGWFRQGRICSCGSSGGWQCLAGLCLDTVPRAVAMACVPQRHKAPGCGRGLFSSCARPCTSRAGAAAAWPLRRAGPWPRPRARA